MADQRRRRWADINPTFGQRLVIAGILLYIVICVNHNVWFPEIRNNILIGQT